MDEERNSKPGSDESLLEEIRENFRYSADYFSEIREQSKIDMRFMCADAWEPKERAKRMDAEQPRPCLDCDELGQYVNQLVNDIRESPRSIKVIPTGAGANDKTAELRANKIRNIEYDSKAQTAYVTAFENAVQRGYGWARINTAPVSESPFSEGAKKLVIRRISNPDSIYPDPDFREADGSDMMWLFVIDWLSIDAFKRDYPDAEISKDDLLRGRALAAEAPRWISEKEIQIAEYWRVETQDAVMCKLADGRIVDSENAPEGISVVEKRDYKRRTVVQRITNGYEILGEPLSWKGRYIPFPLCLGRELWVDDGNGTRRIWESLVRHARGPQQLYNYYRTTQAEVVRMVPKSPFTGARGQFEGHEREWQKVNDTPLAYLEYEAYPKDNPNPAQPMPPPTRPAYDPPVQALEVGAQAARQAIQASMGIMPLPTQAQRQNEKSGVALEKIKSETQQGSYHFVDNFERFLMQCGRVLNDLLPLVYDTERDEAITLPDETHKIVHLHGATQGANGQAEVLTWGDGDHDVTISTGPSYESEREEANAFVDNFLGVIGNLPLDPTVKSELIALAIKMRDLGPEGDLMAEIISPKAQQDIPPQAQAMLKQLNERLQMSDLTVAQLMQEKVAKHAELNNQLAIAKENNQTKIAIAEIQTKAQIINERLKALEEAQMSMQDAAHEAGLSAQEHAQDVRAAQLAPQPSPNGDESSQGAPGPQNG